MALTQRERDGHVELVDESNGIVYARFACTPETVAAAAEAHERKVAARRARQVDPKRWDHLVDLWSTPISG